MIHGKYNYDVILCNMPFDLAVRLMQFGGRVTRADKEACLNSGVVPGITWEQIAWCKQVDMLAKDWQLIVVGEKLNGH